MTDTLLTVKEVAALLRVCDATVHRLIRTGRLPAMRLGRVYRIQRVDVDALLHTPTPAPMEAAP